MYENPISNSLRMKANRHRFFILNHADDDVSGVPMIFDMFQSWKNMPKNGALAITVPSLSFFEFIGLHKLRLYSITLTF